MAGDFLPGRRASAMLRPSVQQAAFSPVANPNDALGKSLLGFKACDIVQYMFKVSNSHTVNDEIQ